MHVRLYTKAGCSLCEDALQLLQRMRHTREFVLEEIDIRSSAALFARYRYTVPVVCIDEVERLSLQFTEAQLAEVLQ